MDKLQSIKGQDYAKRALEVAACGLHSIVLYGPAGSGKTMLKDAFRDLWEDGECKALFDIAEMQPCPCGSDRPTCICSTAEIHRYQIKLVPRILSYDMFIAVLMPRFNDLTGKTVGESFEKVKTRVDTARKKAVDGLPITTNSQNLLKAAMDQLNFTAAQYESAVKIGRTISAMEGADKIRAPHVAEAVQYQFRTESLFGF